MSAETIVVYIDEKQLKAQKDNHYSLFLAKMVNGQFTVIWQSMGPLDTVDHPAYHFRNTFEISVPSYEVNYGTLKTTEGSVTFSAAGIAQTVSLGQTVELDELGIFAPATNTGTSGEITIKNQLAGNPHAVLLDSSGQPVFVNTESGMDIGTATLTPVDTYQIWFDNYQDTGTIIAHNVSNAATVTFSGGNREQSVSYTADGQWVPGSLNAAVDLHGVGALGNPVVVSVLATFSSALTTVAVTYLLSKLINKFPAGLHPTDVEVGGANSLLTLKFASPGNRDLLAVFGVDKFESAVDQALRAAKADKASGLQGETWSLREASIGVSF
ncbi:MAG: hypothetical protein F8N37_23485 [Telmatospirillum sp.]|nr:hypothetical protein [Telmatospirillum sp.]